jgi:hypothetical protein
VEGLLKKMNIERPTSNVEWEKMKKQMKLNCGATRGAHAAQALALRERHHYSMFNVGRSSFKTTPPGKQIHGVCR